MTAARSGHGGSRGEGTDPHCAAAAAPRAGLGAGRGGGAWPGHRGAERRRDSASGQGPAWGASAQPRDRLLSGAGEGDGGLAGRGVWKCLWRRCGAKIKELEGLSTRDIGDMTMFISTRDFFFFSETKLEEFGAVVPLIGCSPKAPRP